MRRSHVPAAIAVLIMHSTFAPVVAADSFSSSSRGSVDYYVKTYGRVDPARLPRVYAVFNSVLEVADKNSSVRPELVVVADRRQARAFVIADGSIVLSHKALDLINDQADATLSDARLAFVIGHELAHLASSDFWDHHGAPDPDVVAGRPQKELKADDLGFLYAALAGYRVERLLRATSTQQDFLTFWMDRVGAPEDDSYPAPSLRAELLRQRLAQRLQSAQSFHFGVRLLHFGRYGEALDLLREFQLQFPSREVFNNLGYGHLHRAIDHLTPALAYHYWLPGISDLYTPLTRMAVRSAEPSRSRSQWKIAPAARQDLLEAARYFELAISKDPQYVAAHINLAITYLLLGMGEGSSEAQGGRSGYLLRAEVASTAAQMLAGNDLRVRELATIARYERGLLVDAAASEPVVSPALESDDPAVNYNLARLHEKFTVVAQRYWEKAFARFETLPLQIRALACKQIEPSSGIVQNNELMRQCGQWTPQSRAPVQPWQLPVQLSRDLLEMPLSEAEQSKLGMREKKLARSRVLAGESSAVLAIDDITTMVVLNDVDESPGALLLRFSQPLERRPIASGELWLYDGWIAWLRDGQVRQVWVAN